MQDSAGLAVLYNLICLGDQHLLYCYLLCAVQYTTAHLQAPFLCNA